MKRNIILWQILEFVSVSLLGVFLHFLYNLTGSSFTAFFSAVNESTWEHMKLIFFPMLFFAVVQYFFAGRKHESFWCIKLIGTLVGLVLIPVLFYTVRGVFGDTPDWINIVIFFVSAAMASIYETKKFLNNCAACKSYKLSLLILCLIAISFTVFTFIPPEIPLFQDPVNGSFGI